MKHSANLEGLYKAAGIDFHAYSQAADVLADRSNYPNMGSNREGLFSPYGYREPISREVLDAMLDKYLNALTRKQFNLNVNALADAELKARQEGKRISNPILKEDPNKPGEYIIDDAALPKILHETLKRPSSSIFDWEPLDRSNGRGYYRAHNDANVRPHKGSYGDIPFLAKMQETNFNPVLPGSALAAAAGTLAGLDEGAGTGLSTGLGGLAGTVAGNYISDALGFGLANDMKYGGLVGSVLGAGLGYAGHNILSGQAYGSAGESKKKKKKKDE